MKFNREFRILFGVVLDDYWDFTTGFELARFMEAVMKPGDRDYLAFVRETKGDRAARLLADLANIR